MRTRPHLAAIDMSDFTEDARLALLLGPFGIRSRKSTLPSDLDGITRVHVAPSGPECFGGSDYPSDL